MRIWLNSVAAVLAALGSACSGEGSLPRNTDPANGAQAGSTGAPVTTGSAGTGAGGGAATGAGDGMATGQDALSLGDPLELVAGTGDIPYAIGENPYGIHGGGFLARSAAGNTITVGSEPGEICISGNLEEVPLNPDGHGNYGQYWGVEFGFNLNQSAPEATEDGLGAVDAGASDASAPTEEVARPWQVQNVIGFSFVIEGPSINLVRFKALPAGYDRSLESSVFCKEITAASGVPQSALFAEMDQYCWSATPNMLLPTAGGLDNLSWQLPADVAPAGARPFDWCLKELRPILAQ